MPSEPPDSSRPEATPVSPHAAPRHAKPSVEVQLEHMEGLLKSFAVRLDEVRNLALQAQGEASRLTGDALRAPPPPRIDHVSPVPASYSLLPAHEVASLRVIERTVKKQPTTRESRLWNLAISIFICAAALLNYLAGHGH